MRRFVKGYWREILLVVVAAGICSFQILLPPYIGLANNGDFEKVAMRFACDPSDGAARKFRYFVSDCEFKPENYWASEVKSSENVLAGIPMLLVRATGARVFNIRWLGALHLLLFLSAYSALLIYLRRLGASFQIVVGGLVLWIFTDVAYVSYFNSYFNDTAAMLGLQLMVPLALLLTAQPRPGQWTVWLFTAASLLFIASKTQHALFGLFPAAFLVWRKRKLPAAILAAAELCMLLMTAPGYSGHSLYSVIFFKLTPHAAAPLSALRELGLGEAEARYIGTYPYGAGSPGDDDWYPIFYHRVGFGKVMRYWIRHPSEAVAALRADLVEQAGDLRPPNIANFRREDGYPPFALTRRFASWSNFRSALYKRWPAHIVFWYVLMIAASLTISIRQPRARGPAVICLGLCVMAVSEFLLASLADAIETERHLFLFHVMTEMTICFAAAWVLLSGAHLADRARRWRLAGRSTAVLTAG